MTESLLAQVRLWTILVALPVAGVCWLAVSGPFALGVFCTALWAAAGFYVLEKLLRAAVVPPGTPRNGFAVFLWFLAKLAIYAIAVWVLFSRPLPGISHAVGFTLQMVVLVAIGARSRSAEITAQQLRNSAPAAAPETAARSTAQGDPE